MFFLGKDYFSRDDNLQKKISSNKTICFPLFLYAKQYLENPTEYLEFFFYLQDIFLKSRLLILIILCRKINVQLILGSNISKSQYQFYMNTIVKLNIAHSHCERRIKSEPRHQFFQTCQYG